MSFNFMPPKDLTSSNENTFSMRRGMFIRTIDTHNKENPEIIKEKQFYGGTRNRDSSGRIHKRATQTFENSFPKNKKLSYQSVNTYNEQNKALKRVRSSGYIVPPKVYNR